MLHCEPSIPRNSLSAARNFDLMVNHPIIDLVSKKPVAGVFHGQYRTAKLLPELVEQRHVIAHVLSISVEVKEDSFVCWRRPPHDLQLFQVHWVIGVKKNARDLVVHF